VIDIKNKTDSIQKFDSIPDFVDQNGARYARADPSQMGNGSNYCRPKISITFQPHEVARYIGICAQDIPAGTEVTLAELRDSSGRLVVSGVFKASAY
jgi:hypothetical protein